jgi:copper chaperone CopZ
MEKKVVQIQKINCAYCTATIQREIGGIEGVVSVEADPETKCASIRWKAPATWTAIAVALEETGFPAAE